VLHRGQAQKTQTTTVHRNEQNARVVRKTERLHVQFRDSGEPNSDTDEQDRDAGGVLHAPHVVEPRGMEKTVRNGPTNPLRAHPVRRGLDQRKARTLSEPSVQPDVGRLFERRPTGTGAQDVLAVRGTVHPDVGEAREENDQQDDDVRHDQIA